jgi:hypothetical protein
MTMNRQTLLSGVTFISVVLIYSAALSQDHRNPAMVSPDEFTTEHRGAFPLRTHDIQGRDWMTLSPENRSSFVLGFLAGLDHVYNSAGLILTLRHSLSAEELADHIYRSLLEQPDIRTGPLDKIILYSLDNLLAVSFLSEDHQLIHLKGAPKQWTKTATLTSISHHQKEKLP